MLFTTVWDRREVIKYGNRQKYSSIYDQEKKGDRGRFERKQIEDGHPLSRLFALTLTPAREPRTNASMRDDVIIFLCK